MSASSKLSTAVKALCYIAESKSTALTSSEIAGGIGINASKLRRLFSMMVKAGLLRSVKGTKGGFELALSPLQIDLQMVYCAIEDRRAFHLNVADCEIAANPISVHINTFFNRLFLDIQEDIENKMKKISIQSIINKQNSL